MNRSPIHIECRKILVRRPEGNELLGRPRRRWVENINMDLERIEWRVLDRSGSGSGPVEGSFEHNNKPSGSIKCWQTLE
jgi:hypothetical protein